MKDYKINVLNELESLTNGYHSVQLRRAALNVGINHLKRQEYVEILNSFIKSHHAFKIYQFADNPKDSFFCSAFVSDNETYPNMD